MFMCIRRVLRSPRVEIFKDRKKEWRFNIIAANRKIVAVSEGYTKKHNAIKGIKAVKKALKNPVIIVRE